MCRVRRALLAALVSCLMAPLHAAPIVPPSIPAGFRNTAASNSPLGSNLAQVTDFTAEYPFVNHFKMARPWFSGTEDVFQDDRPLAKDARGNVSSLQAGQVARSVLFTGVPLDPALRRKRFHVYYDGDGDLFYGNVRLISQAPGHDVIELTDPAEPDAELIAIFTLSRTNPANPLRNIRLLPPGGICARNPLLAVSGAGKCPAGDYRSFAANHAHIVFNPQFLTTIRNYRSLRFMDWMRTNDSTQSDFALRALPANQFWSTAKGVPLEVMIALVNLMDMDPWFNIPHRATDSYVRGFATLLEAQLEPGRRAYIEYSNEVWNPQFRQTGYAIDRGIALGINTLEGNRDDFAGMLHFYARRARQVMDLFEETMGGTTRLRRVMATQAVNGFLTQEILNFENAAAATDVFAIAPYFGDTISDPARRDELLSLGVDGVFDWLRNDDNAVLDFGSLPSVDRAVQAQVEVLAEFGIPLTSYEGGQHFVGVFQFQDDGELNALMDAVNRDPRMKDVYAEYLANWRNRTGGVFHHFLNSDRWSRFGRWGAKEYPTQPRSAAPKYDALMDYVASAPLPP